MAVGAKIGMVFTCVCRKVLDKGQFDKRDAMTVIKGTIVNSKGSGWSRSWIVQWEKPSVRSARKTRTLKGFSDSSADASDGSGTSSEGEDDEDDANIPPGDRTLPQNSTVNPKVCPMVLSGPRSMIWTIMWSKILSRGRLMLGFTSVEIALACPEHGVTASYFK